MTKRVVGVHIGCQADSNRSRLQFCDHTKQWSKGSIATTAVWGHNCPTEGHRTNSFLVESALDFHGATFTRAEYFQKTGHDFGCREGLFSDRERAIC